MKTTYLISAFALAATACAETRSFYAKIDDEFVSLGDSKKYSHGIQTLTESFLPQVPKFSFVDGIATTGEGEDTKVFAVVEHLLVLGDKSEVKPFKIKLDNRSKVLDLELNMCYYYRSSIHKIITNQKPSSNNLKCVPVEVYFMTPAEAKKHIPDDTHIQFKQDEYDQGKVPDVESTLKKFSTPLDHSTHDSDFSSEKKSGDDHSDLPLVSDFYYPKKDSSVSTSSNKNDNYISLKFWK